MRAQTASAGANGISCNDWSMCRLSMNVIQGAGSGGGFAVYKAAQATLDGDTFQNNGTGLIANSGTKVRAGGQARPFISRGNGTGISTSRQGLVYVTAIVENNSGRGVSVQFNSTLGAFWGLDIAKREALGRRFVRGLSPGSRAALLSPTTAARAFSFTTFRW